MIRAGKNDRDNPLIVIGLSEGNITRLKAGQPIKASIRSFGVNLPGEIIVMYGETENEIAKRFRQADLITEHTEVREDAKLSAETAIREKHEHILVCTVGLPRSGKSTWAKSQAYPIVNPDSIRLAIHGQRFIGIAEPFVWATAKAMVRALFLAGHQIVILDVTGNTRKRREEWLSKDWATYFKVIDTSAEICFERAVAESDSEIIPQIERMAAQHEPLAEDELCWP
ncbi:MAG: AAA family ATPase [Blastocatellia bacterium]